MGLVVRAERMQKSPQVIRLACRSDRLSFVVLALGSSAPGDAQQACRALEYPHRYTKRGSTVAFLSGLNLLLDLSWAITGVRFSPESREDGS